MTYSIRDQVNLEEDLRLAFVVAKCVPFLRGSVWSECTQFEVRLSNDSVLDSLLVEQDDAKLSVLRVDGRLSARGNKGETESAEASPGPI